MHNQLCPQRLYKHPDYLISQDKIPSGWNVLLPRSPFSVATLLLAQRCAHPGGVQRMMRQSCCTAIFLCSLSPGCSILQTVGFFSCRLNDTNESWINGVQDRNMKEKSVEFAAKTYMSINGWKNTSAVRKCPCVIICAISSITGHGFVFEPLRMRELVLFIALLDWDLGALSAY